MKAKLKYVLIFFLVLAIPSYHVSAATANTELFTYTITYKYTNIISDTNDDRLVPRPNHPSEYFFYPHATIPLSDYLPNLDRLSGYSDRARNSLYITMCYIKQTESILGDGTVVDRSSNGNFNRFQFYFSNSLSKSYDYLNGDNLQIDFSNDVDLSTLTLRWYLVGVSLTNSDGFGTSGYQSRLMPYTEKYDFVLQIKALYYINLADVIDAIKESQNSITVELDNVEQAVRDGNQQQLDWRNEDKKNATDTQDTITNFANSTESTVRSKWAILFYPIEFTTRIFSVFSGGTSSASYDETYGYIDGYTYNEETGGLEPIYNYYKPVLYDDSSVNITFPAFTLPVLNLKLWDSYTFDLSSLKDSFPAAFNMLYLVEGVVEIYAFVGFLQNKYDEVFGG